MPPKPARPFMRLEPLPFPLRTGHVVAMVLGSLLWLGLLALGWAVTP